MKKHAYGMKYFRLEFPHNYYVDLTKNLLDFKIKMLEEKRK